MDVYTESIQWKGERGMRKAFWMVCILSCLFATVPVAAATEMRGSIRMTLDPGDLPVINGSVSLYQVGVRTEEGYRITESFGGGIVRYEDADSGILAKWLAETAQQTGQNMLLDADGRAVFSELEEGLYMLVQTERIDGFYPINPILLTVPEGDEWDISVYRQPVPVVTELPQTGQSPLPFLGVLGMLLSAAGLILCCKRLRD